MVVIDKLKTDKKSIIITLILVIILGGVGLFIFDGITHNNITESKKHFEASGANLVKASIDLHYVVEGRYPLDTDDLIKNLETYSPKNDMEIDFELLRNAINNLKDFEYVTRGDGQAYKFTYTDLSGNKKTLEGNYKQDFH